MKRREFLAGSAVAAGSLLMGPGGRAENTRPNVLLIIVDQWRQRRWFPEAARLPASERLSREGMTFTNFFTSAVPCSPSRATLLTGLHITQHGLESNVNAGMQASLDPNIPTLGHVFSDAGYQTPYFGKWHLTDTGVSKKEKLDAYGFTGWVPPDRHGKPYEGLLHDRDFAGQAVDWLQKNGKGGKPWFLTLSLVNPHDICFYSRLDLPPALVPNVFSKLPPNFNDDLAAKPRVHGVYQEGYGKLMGSTPDQPEKYWRRYLDFYYYLTQKADEQMGRVLDELDWQGLAQNTIVIFTSDHGDMCGSHKLQAKGPFIYQENTNVPFIVRWPGMVPAGAETSAVSHNPDVFPTIAALAGLSCDTSHLPGRNLLPALKDPGATSPDDYALFTFGDFLGDASQDGGRGLIGKLATHAGVDAKGVPVQLRGIFDGRHKFARYFGPGATDEFELYDLQEDPGELTNLASDASRAALRKEMEDRLSGVVKRDMDPERMVLRPGS